MKYSDIREVKPEGSFLKAICFKPKRAPLICIAAGIGMLFVNDVFVRILGVFFIAMSLLVLKFVQDRKVMDIFDRGVMIYGDGEAATACFIPYEDVKIWSVKHRDGHDTIEFILQDGEQIVLNTFEASRAYHTLNSLMKEKEERYLQKLEDRKKELYLPDAVRNLVRRLGNRK